MKLVTEPLKCRVCQRMACGIIGTKPVCSAHIAGEEWDSGQVFEPHYNRPLVKVESFNGDEEILPIEYMEGFGGDNWSCKWQTNEIWVHLNQIKTMEECSLAVVHNGIRYREFEVVLTVDALIEHFGDEATQVNNKFIGEYFYNLTNGFTLRLNIDKEIEEIDTRPNYEKEDWEPDEDALKEFAEERRKAREESAMMDQYEDLPARF